MSTVTLRSLENSPHGPVYVRNTSNGNKRGIITISIPKMHGRSGYDTVRIPHTFIPVDLTTQVPKEQLLSCSEFRRALATGLLELVTSDAAESELSSSHAKEEMERLAEEEADTNKAIANMLATGDTSVPTPDKSNIPVMSNADQEETILPWVEQLIPNEINKAELAKQGGRKGKGISQVSIISILRMQEEEMGDADIDYLIEEATQHKLTRVVTYLESLD